MTKEQLEVFSNTKPELRYLTEEIIKYLNEETAAPPSGPGYLVYTALLTQNGTSAPVATVLQNTLGGAVIWSRISAGDYLGTLASAFPENKTFCLACLSATLANTVIIQADRNNNNNNSVQVISADGTWSNQDSGNFQIEIRVYP